MPAWGGKSVKLGNNPLVIALPRAAGPLVLDMAMSQFSFGKLEEYRRQKLNLPVPGGFDDADHLTHDAAVIEKKFQTLAVGYWKGAGLSIMLDLLAAVMASGLATHEISQLPSESALSQVFIAINVADISNRERIERLLNTAVADLHDSVPRKTDESVFYPGKRTLKTRKENMQLGIPVQADVWEKILAM